jgi:hypothetical protein
MNDSASTIAAIKIGTRIVFRFKFLDPPILVYILPAPNGVKSAAGRSLYPVTPILKLAVIMLAPPTSFGSFAISKT